MPANIKLTYSEITTVCNTLDTSVDQTLVPRMTDAKAEVDTLLTTNLVMTKASPALQTQYEKFNTALTQAAESIKGYATQFRQIMESVQNMDKEIADNVNSQS